MSEFDDFHQGADQDEATTFAEDFAEMRARIIAYSNGGNSVSGVIENAEQNALFRAGYTWTEQPPRIVQVVIADSNTDYSVTRIGVNEATDDPIVEMSRHSADITNDAALLAELHARDTTMVTLGEMASSAVFDSVYANLVEDIEFDA